MTFFHRLLAVFMLLCVVTPGVTLSAGVADDDSTGGGIASGFERVKKFQGEAGIKDFGTLTDLILALLRILTAFLAALAVAAIIYGGFLYITSAGNESKAEQGKQVIIYAVIGLLIVGAAGILVNIVINIFAAP